MRFSRFAVIGPIDENDKRPTLMVRIADIQRKLYLAESHVRLYIVNSKVNHVIFIHSMHQIISSLYNSTNYF